MAAQKQEHGDSQLTKDEEDGRRGGIKHPFVHCDHLSA